MELSNAGDILEMLNDIGKVAERLNSINIFDYVGFDAEKISSEFMKNAQEANIQGPQLDKDMADIVLIGLSKGNLREHLFNKFEKVGRARIEELKTRYKIRTRREKGQPISTSSESMTFARSIRVFPKVASDLIKRGLYNPKLTRNLLFSNELPAVFKHSGFAALIPKRNEVGSVFFHAFLVYQIEFSFWINRSLRRKRTVKEEMDKQLVYISKAWGGEFIEFDERVSLMKEYEINTREVLEVCLKVANKLLSEVEKETFDAEKILETYVDENGLVDFVLQVE